MTEPGLHVTLSLPFQLESHAVSAADHALWQQAALLLRVINEMESAPAHDSEAPPAMHRIEAKLDLTLNLLAQALHGGKPALTAMELNLWSDGLSWPAGTAIGRGDSLLISIQLSAALPLPVRLPVEVTESTPALVRARWIGATEEGLDAWGQWLFRQHRRAIHAAREGR